MAGRLLALRRALAAKLSSDNCIGAFADRLRESPETAIGLLAGSAVVEQAKKLPDSAAREALSGIVATLRARRKDPAVDVLRPMIEALTPFVPRDGDSDTPAPEQKGDPCFFLQNAYNLAEANLDKAQQQLDDCKARNAGEGGEEVTGAGFDQDIGAILGNETDETTPAPIPMPDNACASEEDAWRLAFDQAWEAGEAFRACRARHPRGE